MAVGLDNGIALKLSVDAQQAWHLDQRLDTLSESPVSGLAYLAAATGSGPLVLATKPQDGSLVALSPATGRIAWGVSIPGSPRG